MRTSGIAAIFCVALMCSTAPRLEAQIYYQIDNVAKVINAKHSYEIFNNSAATDTEDNWVANSFVVNKNGEVLTSIQVGIGSTITGKTVTAAIYTGVDLFNPNAGGGLKRIVGATNTVPVTSAAGTLQTIPFSFPVVLPVGQVFYAAVLMQGVTSSQYPFVDDYDITTPASSPSFLGFSYFDVGSPVPGSLYNLDNTLNVTRLGGTNPVVGSGIQHAANLVLRVNSSSATPEPGSLAFLTGLGLSGGAFFLRRRCRKA